MVSNPELMARKKTISGHDFSLNLSVDWVFIFRAIFWDFWKHVLKWKKNYSDWVFFVSFLFQTSLRVDFGVKVYKISLLFLHFCVMSVTNSELIYWFAWNHWLSQKIMTKIVQLRCIYGLPKYGKTEDKEKNRSYLSNSNIFDSCCDHQCQ